MSRIVEAFKRELEQLKTIKSDVLGLRGYKYSLDVDLKDLKIKIPVKIAKIKPKPMVVVERRGPNGGRIEAHYSEKHYYEVIGDEKHEISPDQIYYVQVMPDGKEEIVEPLDRTETIKPIKLIPLTDIDNFLIESYYQLWSEDNLTLYELAKKLKEMDKALVGLFTFGGYKAYTFILYPIIRGDEFVMIMALTTCRKEIKAWMPTNKTLKTKTKKFRRKKKVKGAKKLQVEVIA